MSRMLELHFGVTILSNRCTRIRRCAVFLGVGCISLFSFAVRLIMMFPRIRSWIAEVGIQSIPVHKELSSRCLVLLLEVDEQLKHGMVHESEPIEVDVNLLPARDSIQRLSNERQSKERGRTFDIEVDALMLGLVMPRNADMRNRPEEFRRGQHDANDDTREKVGRDDRQRGDDEDDRLTFPFLPESQKAWEIHQLPAGIYEDRRERDSGIRERSPGKNATKSSNQKP